jgi:site-specific DNA-adenine methylase
MNRLPITWDGSKVDYAAKIVSLMPNLNGGWYLEPFLGTGAVLLEVLRQYKPCRVMVNDADGEIINLWTQCIYFPTELEELLDGAVPGMVVPEARGFDSKGSGNLVRAANFYLDHQKSNGMNQPSRKLVNDFQELSKMCKGVAIYLYQMDAVRFLNHAKYCTPPRIKQVVVYADPPYPKTDCSQYGHGIDHFALKAKLQECVDSKANVFVSSQQEDYMNMQRTELGYRGRHRVAARHEYVFHGDRKAGGLF